MQVASSSDDWLDATAEQLRFLFGVAQPPTAQLKFYVQFGYYGYAIHVYAEHVSYLQALSIKVSERLPAFTGTTIDRWRAVNDLLVAQFTGLQVGTPSIDRQAPAMAALVAFPTLEEVARLLSGRWDEEGRLLGSVDTTDNVSSWNPDGSRTSKTYKEGQRLVLLAHKLQLMHRSLHPDLACSLEDLDRFLERPTIQGANQPMAPLYERLQYFRDHWSHGRRYEGWEALLVSLLLALLYFGLDLPPSETAGEERSNPPLQPTASGGG